MSIFSHVNLPPELVYAPHRQSAIFGTAFRDILDKLLLYLFYNYAGEWMSEMGKLGDPPMV